MLNGGEKRQKHIFCKMYNRINVLGPIESFELNETFIWHFWIVFGRKKFYWKFKASIDEKYLNKKIEVQKPRTFCFVLLERSVIHLLDVVPQNPLTAFFHYFLILN